ncbi:hypothetical protein AB0E08_07705 [Streptomyces sp. NPDC048281]|uniref:hypothetical protein n=1 Tax=Streptomyces sp. NPDC048281 TaxID=3154715 RepID=UPI0034187345
MDTASLMWDEATRDHDHERQELARTAALTDAERMVGQFLYQADNDVDLINRLALADSQLQAVASLRGYPLQDLTGDLTRRWRLLSQARTATAQKTAAARKVTAAQERAMDMVAARLAAVAARQNPAVPMVECLKLATEAVRVHADAYPLAYESWGGTGDGPITHRVKNFTPGQLPKPLPESASGPAADPGANGGSRTFDEVHRRLDGLEEGLGATSSLDPTMAGFYQRLKDWWHGGNEEHTPAPAPAPTHTEPEHVGPYDPTGWHGGAPARHAEDRADQAAEHAHDQAGRREFDDIMNRLDNDQADMRHKFDNPGYNEHRPWRTRIQDADRMEQATDAHADHLERRLNEAGAPQYHPSPIQHSLFD